MNVAHDGSSLISVPSNSRVSLPEWIPGTKQQQQQQKDGGKEEGNRRVESAVSQSIKQANIQTINHLGGGQSVRRLISE